LGRWGGRCLLLFCAIELRFRRLRQGQRAPSKTMDKGDTGQ
jgi:hypothetical protein